MSDGRLNFNLLVGVLGVVVLTIAVGGIVLSALGDGIPDALIALGSGALGALGTAFVHPPNGRGDPVPVEVVEQPVVVETVDDAKAWGDVDADELTKAVAKLRAQTTRAAKQIEEVVRKPAQKPKRKGGKK